MTPPPAAEPRAPLARPLWLLAAPGDPEERAALLGALAHRGEPLYARPKELPALRLTLTRPWGAPLTLGADVESVEGALAAIEESSARLTSPWTHAARVAEAPALLPAGRFTLCLDDSLIGAPRTLLVHWGAEPLYRVPPPALTLPAEGALSCLRVEEVSAGELLTLRLTLCDARLAPVAGPWSLTSPAP